MNPEVPRRGNSEPWSRADTFIVLGLMLVFTLLLTWSYGRMLHPIVDSGRDLYIPERLLAGQKLYADIRYPYPPLAPYLLAAITAVIGHGLGAYYAIGLVVSMIVTAATFTIGRRFGGSLSAGVSALLVITCSLTGATARGCNFFFPYAHAATFGLMFFLLHMLLLAQYVFGLPGCRVTGSPGLRTAGGGTTPFVLALATGLSAAWLKIEFTVFVALTLALALLVRRFVLGDAGRRIVALTAFAVASYATTFAFAEIYFGRPSSGQHSFLHDVFRPPLINAPITRRLYAAVIGLNDWPRNLIGSVFSAILVVLIALAAAMLTRAFEAGGRVKRYVTAGIAIVVVALLSIPLANQQFFRAWSVLQLVVGVIALICVLRKRADPIARDEHLRVLFLLLFSLCCSSRIYLNLAPFWYGFAYIIATDLLIAHVLFSYAPSLGIYSRRAAMIWMIPVLVVAGRAMAEQQAAYAAKRFPVHTARGVFCDDVEDRAAVLNEFLTYTGRRGARSLVVMPEGIAMNYFLGIPDPLTYNTFSAVEIATPELERDVVREIDTRKPELIALDNQYVREFGVAEFGVGYGTIILDDLRSHYVVEQRWRTPTFSMVLLRRAR